MSSAAEVEKLLTELLHKAAKKLNLKKYSLNLNSNAIKGDGFLGEFYKVSIRDDETGTVHYLAVKKSAGDEEKRKQNSIDLAYENEIGFYSEIYPAFKKFEEEHNVAKPFGSIARYITSESEKGKETLVFEDITKLGYVLREKNLLLDDEHAKLIFKTYGHFHSISFCLKEQKPEEFTRLSKPLHPIWREFGTKDYYIDYLKDVYKEAAAGLDSSRDKLVLEEFQKYVDKTQEIYDECSYYKGQYFGITHGDCWSNNMMFKYEDTENFYTVKALKLLDFQLTVSGTPVYDLSYFFYTGGSKELFDNLEGYLDIYYESFSKSATELGCDPNILFPREMLREDWKQYAKFGMMLSLMLCKIKLISKEDSIKMIDAPDQKAQKDEYEKIQFDKELFRKRTRDIIVHMHEIGAL